VGGGRADGESEESKSEECESEEVPGVLAPAHSERPVAEAEQEQTVKGGRSRPWPWW